MKFLIALAFILAVSTAHAHEPSAACRAAHAACEWKFQPYGPNKIPTFDFTDSLPDLPVTSKVITKKLNSRIGILNTKFAAEFVNDDGTIVDITEEGTPAFKRSHFKPYKLPKRAGSGIGHQTFTGNQAEVASGRCVRLYFSQFQRLFGKQPPFVKKNVFVDKDANKCVVFLTMD